MYSTEKRQYPEDPHKFRITHLSFVDGVDHRHVIAQASDELFLPPFPPIMLLPSQLVLQWNLPKTDTTGTEPCVHYMEGVHHSEVFGLSPSADVYMYS